MTDIQLVHSVNDEHPLGRSPDFMLRTAGYRVKRWPDGEAFLNGADNSQPACALLNLSRPGLDALTVQARMPAAGLDFPVVLTTGHGDLAMAVQAMKAGAADILESPFDPDKLLRAVQVAFDQLADRESHRERARSARRRLAGLNPRERDVLDRLACGYPNQTIARDLSVGVRAVEAHRDVIVIKLGLGNFADALRLAFAAGSGYASEWAMAHPGVRR